MLAHRQAFGELLTFPSILFFWQLSSLFLWPSWRKLSNHCKVSMLHGDCAWIFCFLWAPYVSVCPRHWTALGRIVKYFNLIRHLQSWISWLLEPTRTQNGVAGKHVYSPYNCLRRIWRTHAPRWLPHWCHCGPSTKMDMAIIKYAADKCFVCTLL